MKTLNDYVRGNGFVPILLVQEYKGNGKKLYLCKEETRTDYFFMDGKEVCFAVNYPSDRTYELSLDIINKRNVEQALVEIKKQPAYKRFQQFIKDRT